MTVMNAATGKAMVKPVPATVRPALSTADYCSIRLMESQVAAKLAARFPRSVAADAATDGLVATALRWSTLEQPEAFMYTTAYNAAVDIMRKKEKKTNEVLMTTVDIDFFTTPALPDTSIELEDLLSRELLPTAAQFARLVMGRASLKEAALELGIDRDDTRLVMGQIRKALAAAWGLTSAQLPTPHPGGPEEATTALRESVDQLTPRQREAVSILLRGYKRPADVAQQMGVDPNNARVTLHSAKRRLSRILGWSTDEVAHVIQLCQVQAADGRRTAPAA